MDSNPEVHTPNLRLHGRTIKYNQIAQIPTRNDFIHPSQFTKVNTAINKNQNIMFMPNAIKETHMQDAKYDKSKYKIIIWGILQDGRRATVVLNKIQPYFEVLTPPQKENQGTEAGDFAEDLFNKLKKQDDTTPTKYEIHTGKQFKYYNENKNYYIRFYFDKSTFRTAAIKFVRTLNLETTHDDLTCYYRVACRDKLMSLTSWNILSNYTIGTDKSIKGPIFHVDTSTGGYTEFLEDLSNTPDLLKDNSMTMTWDIETYSPDGQLPVPENPKHRIFMIATTFHWYHSTDALLRVCIVDQPCKPHKDFLTIVCDNEERVIKAFGKIFEKMKPEFLIGFNDSDYDWPWLVTRASKTPGILTHLAKCMDATIPWKPYNEADIMKYNFTKDKVKVEADSYAEGNSLQFPGYINLDVRTIFRQLYPTAEKSSLAWFLQMNKLGGKKEMPYQEMFKIYRRMTRLNKSQQEQKDENDQSDDEDANEFAVETRKCQTTEDFSERMREVAEYCVIDAQRCQDLLKMRTVIMERREVSKVAYTSLYEAFFRANGSKVRNLVIARGQTIGLKISNITDENQHHPEGKYPGAYVFAPRKGLVTSKLTMRERRDKAHDHKKKNLELSEELHEWIKITDDEIEIYETFISKSNIIYIDFSKESPELRMLHEAAKAQIPKCIKSFFEEITGRPITGLDFSSLYPSLIMTYNLSPEYMIINKKHARDLDSHGVKLHKIKFSMSGTTYRAWSVAHENKIDPTRKSSTIDYKFGIYPQILKELFDNRKIMQKDLKKWEALKEQMESLPSAEFNTLENRTKYENIEFNYNCINSKQKALKVFMNTFYGETGNKNSPFFLLELAGGITALGQKNIKAAHRFIVDAGCSTWYGDTDSIYCSMPERHFTNIDIKYYSGKMTKMKYWTELVEITFHAINEIRDGVNSWFKADNGTEFLRMAYEEALFPVAFLAKKKYYGIPHLSVPNFNYKHLFIKGLEVMKRGVSQFLRDTCNDIMKISVSPTNLSTLLELIQNKIRSIYAKEPDSYSFDDFIMTDVYKPNKQNTKVQTFAARMQERGIKIKPWERFNYVIVKKNPYFYDHRGRKATIGIGDKMELASTAKEQKMEIDLDYYMEGSINGQLARLIVYHPLFYSKPLDESQDEIDIAEKKIYVNASKYIENFCKAYYTNYKSKGKIYQKVFKIANKTVNSKLKEIYEDEVIIDLISSNCDIEKLEEWLCDKAEKTAIKESKGYGQAYIEDQLRQAADNTPSEPDTEPAPSRQLKKAKHARMKELQEVYFSNKENLSKARELQFKQRAEILKRNIKENLNGIKQIFGINRSLIETLSEKIKTIIQIDEKYNESDNEVPTWDNIPETQNIEESTLAETINDNIASLTSNAAFWKSITKLKFIYNNLISNYVFIHKTRSIVDHLKTCRDRTTNTNLGRGFNATSFIRESTNLNIGSIPF